MSARLRWVVPAVALASLAACEVGPDYKRPTAPTPAAYKELDGWKPSEPQDAGSGTAWWSIYKDPLLDQLEAQIDVSNQTLKASEAAFRQASALVEEARTAFFPTVGLDTSAQRSGTGGGQTGRSTIKSQFSVTGSLSWEIDVWGRIRRSVEASYASAEASAADLAAARLSAQSVLATDYLDLRISDELKRLLDATVDADTKSLQITQNRYTQGTAARSDVAQAQAQVEGVRALAINVGVQRAQLEHAIAVLIGKPPAEFSIAPTPLELRVPVVPPGVPSTLLERRPDIAAAERATAAANAQIGVAIAAYYPAITLSASYGFLGSAIENLFRASNAVWSVGPQLAETVFDAGLRSAQVAAARAAYDQTIANYRQTVLAAFQQVEDQLAALRILEQQAEVQNRAVRAAEEAERLILNQYTAGTVAYTNVITAQTVSLSNKQTALAILQSRLAASVVLIEALGGGWTAADLPSHDRIRQGLPPAGTGASSP
ncbi:MAG TPA: efflux transporter outer membrane subunit [Stellaceae bacterium]|nr:efflux transporter outer membrane subunit [Stellaceae bacterium]